MAGCFCPGTFARSAPGWGCRSLRRSRTKPTDRPTAERFFRTLHEGLIQHLPAYKSPDLHARGERVEDEAFLFLHELEDVIREWIATVYHRAKHRGLAVVRRWAGTTARTRPEPLTTAQSRRLGAGARADCDDARHDWQANFGTIRTPQLAATVAELDGIVASNRQAPDRVRGAAVIDALPGLGKTTIANCFARAYD